MKKQSNQPLIYTAAGVAIIGSLFLGYKYLSPRTADINEVTHNGAVVDMGAPTWVAVGGTSYQFGVGGGYGSYDGEGSQIRMDGVTDGDHEYFYPWGYSGPGAPNFNPSKGVVPTTADGKIYGWGPVYARATNPTPYKQAPAVTTIVAPPQPVTPGNLSVATPVASAKPAATSTNSVGPNSSPLTAAPTTSTTYKPSDLNKDGKVNIIDYNIFVADYKK